MTLNEIYDIVDKQSRWKLDDAVDFAEKAWPRMNPHLGDKLMYKKPDVNSEQSGLAKLKPAQWIDGLKEVNDSLSAISKLTDDLWKEELTRQQNELINKEYIMQCNENVRMRIDYEKMAAPYIKPSEAKKKNPVFLRIDIKNVIFNPPATIVFWTDNTKTVVKAQDGEEYDPEKGLTMAICKKVYGNEGNYFNKIKKWTEPAYEELKEDEEMSLKVMELIADIISGGLKNAKFKPIEEPLTPLNKEICKRCVKGAPYGDCSHFEPGCRHYDMFEPINSTTWPDEDDRLPVRDDS